MVSIAGIASATTTNAAASIRLRIGLQLIGSDSIPIQWANAAPAVGFELLRGLPAAAGSRKALHREVGEITLSQMLHEWALHDLGHIRQVAELVRARKYLAGAGPPGKEYRLIP